MDSDGIRKDRPASEGTQQPLWIESWADGVQAIAQTLGGRKALALRLRPTKGDAAGRWLADCCNPERAEKFDVEDFIAILRIGREAGVHCLMAHLTERAGYAPPVPVTPDDVRSELQRAYIGAVEQLAQIVRRMDAQPASVRGLK